MSTNGKKLLAITVLREIEDRTKVRVIAMNIGKSESGVEMDAEKAAKVEIRIGWKLASMTKAEEMWTRVESVRRMEREGEVMVGARSNGEVTIIKVQIPKELWGKNRTWGILTKSQQIEQLQKIHPYVELSEVIIQPEDWHKLSAEAEKYGMYTEDWGAYI